MEEVPFPDENCSGLTEEQFTAIALARGITAAICCTILFTALVVNIILAMFTQLRARVCGTVIKRLIIGLTGVDVAYQLTIALHLVHYNHPQERIFCEVDGFLNQYFASVQLFLTLEICLVLFIKVLKVTTFQKFVVEYYKKAEQSTSTCCNRKINKLEVVHAATILLLPLIFEWIPFTTGSYGHYGAWCWIRILESDCSVHSAGYWEQIWLWYVPYGLVVFLTLGLFIASMCLLGYAIRNARVKKQILASIVDSLISLASLAIIFTLRLLQKTITAYSDLQYIKQEEGIINSVIDPLSGAVIPLALLLAIHIPLSAVILKCTHYNHPRLHQRGDDEPTLERRTRHDSSDWSVINKPSHTTFEPSHSSYESSERVPLAQAMHDNYGSNA